MMACVLLPKDMLAYLIHGVYEPKVVEGVLSLPSSMDVSLADVNPPSSPKVTQPNDACSDFKSATETFKPNT